MTPRSIVLKAVPLFIGTVFLLPLLAVMASAQSQGVSIERDTKASYQARDGEALVIISVFAENGRNHLDRQSVVKMTNEITKNVIWQTTDGNSEAAVGLLFGKYEIEISAVGYLSQKKEVQANNTLITTRMEFSLHRDPNAVDLNISEGTVPPKARGDLKTWPFRSQIRES
jgi:hypothetical protein